MKKDFLPKILNYQPDTRTCLNVNIGLMSTELHYHNCVEIIYVESGSVSVFFDNGWRTLNKGALLFVPPGCIHRFVSRDASARQTVIGFTDELICENNSSKKSLLCPYRTGAITTGCLFSLKDHPVLNEVINKIINRDENTSFSYSLSLDADILNLYSVICGIWEKSGIIKKERVNSLLANKIKKYVSENYALKISAEELSHHLNISYSYLAKIMMREFGTSLGNYIISHRIENSKRLLLSTYKSVAEIGYECGFASSSAFISHFKALTGKTPLVFRSEALKEFTD